MKKMKCLVAVLVVAVLGILKAQDLPSSSSSGGSDGETPVASAPPVLTAPDLSMLTNHGSLVAYAFKQVKGTKVSVSSGAQVNNWEIAGFLEVTNEVKSLDVLNDIITPFWWGVTLADPKAYVSINAQLWNTGDYNDLFGYNGKGTSPYVLFDSYNGGYPIPGPGYLTLPPESTGLQLRLAPQIKVKIPGLDDARLVMQDEYGNHYGVPMSNAGNDEMWWTSDYSGYGTLVLTRHVQGTDGYWYSYTKGYSLTNGAEVPLTSVQFGVLLEDSEDFRSFKNQMEIHETVFTYQSYGKVPLLITTFDKASVTNVSLSVRTSEGQYATAFEIENQQTKVKRTVKVPPGASSVKTEFKGGVHYIVPLGIQLKAPRQYWYYYGGKG